MIDAFIGVWTSLMTFFTGLFGGISELFWNTDTSSLTFIGTLAIIMAGIAILLLVFNLIRSFFPMRG